MGRYAGAGVDGSQYFGGSGGGVRWDCRTTWARMLPSIKKHIRGAIHAGAGGGLSRVHWFFVEPFGCACMSVESFT